MARISTRAGRRGGPPPEATALRMLRGNPGKRAVNADEPKPPPGSEEPPEALTGKALELWQARVPQIAALRCLADVDREHLARACRQEAHGLELLAEAEARPIVETPNNGRVSNPALKAALAAFRAADDVWFRFPITPSERSRIKASGHGDQDPLSKFAQQRRTPA